MNSEIENIWIESEEKGAILSGESEVNDNSDVVVTMQNGEKYISTLFTYENIMHLKENYKKSGECLSGKYFWASDMLIVERINRKEIEELIQHLIEENEFEVIFRKIT